MILVPVLRRPHRVQPLLDSIRATTDGCRVLWLATAGDTAQIDAIDDVGGECVIINHHPGDYARKILVGYLMTTEPLVVTAADDLEFQSGWFEAATAALTPGIGVVGLNDDANPRVMSGQHATHFLMTREYIDQYGTVDQRYMPFHLGYVHEFVDDEAIGTARQRKAYAFAADAHVTHLHPSFNKTVPMDDLYAGQDQRLRTSRPLFNQRRRLWMRPLPRNRRFPT